MAHLGQACDTHDLHVDVRSKSLDNRQSKPLARNTTSLRIRAVLHRVVASFVGRASWYQFTDRSTVTQTYPRGFVAEH